MLLVSLDTVRADHLSLYGYEKTTSPNLDAWAQRSAVVFEETVAGAPWTLPSHMVIFSGLNAVRHGINHDVGRAHTDSATRFEFLAEILRKQGYETAAVTGGAYMHPQYGFSRGFRSYRYWQNRGRDKRELVDGVDRALAFLEKERSQPFFFFLHTYAAHDPYEAYEPFFEEVAAPGLVSRRGEIALKSIRSDASKGFRQETHFEYRNRGIKQRLGESDRPLIEAFYDSGLARLDSELGRLFAGLEDLGLADTTLVVVTSDHGEALLEQGRVGHQELYDSNLLVPLVIAWPDGRGAGHRVSRQVRSVDILPTLLQSLEVRSPRGLDGVSMLPLVENSAEARHPTEAWAYSANRK